MNRAMRITREIQKHDNRLYADYLMGQLCVFRKTTRYEEYDVDGQSLIYARPDKYLIFAITDNWQMSGRPVDWGLLPIRARLNAMDMQQREDFMKELEDSYEKDAKSMDRKLDTSLEGFLYESRDKFKSDFKDINTANLAKIDKRRIRDGYRK